MNIIDKIWNLIHKKKIIEPVFVGKIINSELSTLLSNRFPNVTIAISDMSYDICTKQSLMEFIKTIHTPNISGNDCDDRAFILLAEVKKSSFNTTPFGFVWVNEGNRLHALNLFINETKDLYVVEPQDGSMFTFPVNWKPYLIVL